MASVDTSIYGNIQPVNPMANMANTANAIMSMNNARMMQMQINARSAIGPIIQAATDPQGNVNWNKVFVGAASNPNTSWMAMDLYQHGIQNKYIQAETANQELENAKNRTEAMQKLVAPLLKKGTSITSADVQNQLALGVGQGVFDAQHAVQLMSGLPEGGQQLYDAIHDFATAGQSVKDSLDSVYGTLHPETTGQGTQLLSVAPQNENAPVRSLGFVAQQPSLADINKPTTEQNPQTGTTYPTTQGNILARSGIPLASGTPGPVYGPQGEQLNAQSPTLTLPTDGGASTPGGGIPLASPTPTAQQQASGSFSPANRPVTAIGPTQEKYLTDLGGSAAQYKKGLDDRAQEAYATVSQLQQLQEAAKHFNPGGGAHAYQFLGQLAQAVGMPQETVDQISNGNLAATQEFDKFALNNAAHLLRQGLGGGQRFTNTEFESFVKSNPNISTDPRAIRKMLNYFITMAKIPLMEQKYYQQDRQNGGDPTSWPSRWNQALLDAHIGLSKVQ